MMTAPEVTDTSSATAAAAAAVDKDTADTYCPHTGMNQVIFC